MRRIFGFANEDPNESSLSRLISDIHKAEQKDLAPLYNQIAQFLPDKAQFIVEKILPNMIAALIRQPPLVELQSAIINLIYQIINSNQLIGQNSPTINAFLSHPKFVSVILMQTNSDNNRIFEIIMFFFQYNRKVFTDFLSKSPVSLLPLIKGICTFGNPAASDLFINLIKLIPEHVKPIKSQIMSSILQMPPKISTYLVKNIPEFHNIDTEGVLKNILNSESDENISVQDVANIFDSWPKILNSDDTIRALLLASKSDGGNIKEVEWVRNLKINRFAVSIQLHKKFESKLKSVSDNSLSFLYLFAASFMEYSKLSNQLDTIIQFAFHEEEYVSAAALQVLCTWLLKEKFEIPVRVVYLTAAYIVDPNLSRGIRSLYQILLRILADNHFIIHSLATNEPSLQYNPSENILIIKALWCFPNFPILLKSLDPITYINPFDSISALGCIAKTLELIDVKNVKSNGDK